MSWIDSEENDRLRELERDYPRLVADLSALLVMVDTPDHYWTKEQTEELLVIRERLQQRLERGLESGQTGPHSI